MEQLQNSEWKDEWEISTILRGHPITYYPVEEMRAMGAQGYLLSTSVARRAMRVVVSGFAASSNILYLF